MRTPAAGTASFPSGVHKGGTAQGYARKGKPLTRRTHRAANGRVSLSVSSRLFCQEHVRLLGRSHRQVPAGEKPVSAFTEPSLLAFSVEQARVLPPVRRSRRPR